MPRRTFPQALRSAALPQEEALPSSAQADSPAPRAPRRASRPAASAPVRAPRRATHGHSAPQPEYLPMSRQEMEALGWKELDVLMISGDAYVDHYAMGSVLLGRWLLAHGYRVGLVCQPRWDTEEDLLVMGRPRLFAGVSAGALDSLLAHYTAFRKKRHDDAYTPGGKAGARPNRACIVYTNLVRRAFPGLPVILGGIEASLRRVTHYDFWTDKLRHSILMDAKADLLAYGMGERAMLECARRLEKQQDIRGVDGTAWMDSLDENGQPAHLPPELQGQPCMLLPGHEQLQERPAELLRQTRLLEQQVHRLDAWAFEPVGQRAVVLARPAAPLTTEEMDALYSLPFTRKAHPSYRAPIPAEEMLRTSITSHRGCGGGCSFCSLAIHQGRRISSRSRESILAEAARLAEEFPSRRGGVAISDVGGPTANMWQGHCALDAERRTDGHAPRCRRSSCCYPTVCRSFITPQQQHVELLRDVAALPGVRQVRVASGVRADLALRDPAAMAAYTGEFTGGQLKVAPEHCVPAVLDRMRKPPLETFEAFLESFMRQSRLLGREQYVVPYLMSAFPGCTDDDMRTLARWLAQRHWSPQQTQCFIPTPGSLATAMFYAGCDEAGEPLYVARSDAERLRQHRILMPHFGRPGSGSDDAVPAPRRPAFRQTDNLPPAMRTGRPPADSRRADPRADERPTRRPSARNDDEALADWRPRRRYGR